jgi:hypothetical protein
VVGEAFLTLTLVTTEGVGAWGNGNRSTGTADAEPIAGFPVKSMGLTMSGECSFLVDVADNQYLWAAAQVPRQGASQFPEKCSWARQLGEAAMSNLLAK